MSPGTGYVALLAYIAAGVMASSTSSYIIGFGAGELSTLLIRCEVCSIHEFRKVDTDVQA